MPKFAIFNDIHLKPTDEATIKSITLPEGTEAVVITGDIVDRATEDGVSIGREFLNRLNDVSVPTILVPGNHDPHDVAAELVADFEYVQLAHGRRVTGDDFPESSPFETVTVVGWGCTGFDLGCELTYKEAFEIRDEYGRIDRYAEQQAVQRLLEATDALLTGAAAIESELGLSTTAQTQLEEVARIGTRLISLLEHSKPACRQQLNLMSRPSGEENWIYRSAS
jgi:hypothetical protein